MRGLRVRSFLILLSVVCCLGRPRTTLESQLKAEALHREPLQPRSQVRRGRVCGAEQG